MKSTINYALFVLPLFILISGLQAQETIGRNLWQPFYISPRTGSQHVSLDGQWQLGYSAKKVDQLTDLSTVQNWFTTNVPGGTVHWALYRAGKLPDMYEHLNSKLYEWVEDSVWYYKKSFDLDKDISGYYVMLVFDGIDYFSRVWLNGELLGNHQGMYGGPAIEVSKLVKAKGNEVVVEVRSGKETREKGWEGRRDPKNVIKGWEFTGGTGAEPFYTVGMWQGARLEIVPKIHLERPFLITQKLEDGKAFLQLKAEVFVNKQSLDYNLHPWTQKDVHSVPFYGTSLYDAFKSKPFDRNANIKIELIDADGKVLSKEWNIQLFEERNWISEKFEIQNPKLWWPNGMGDPNLYKANVSLQIGGKTVDQIDFDYGIRTIETVASAGPQVGDFWDNWQFVVNGRPFFMKGVNWMPADLLLDLPYDRYKWLVEIAKSAGVQMFRIWGSGLIETENFYEVCNKAGIMVWSEYSMANWDAPEFPLDVFESQVVWSIFRLRNHPSLAVHCGGNEYNAYSKANSVLTGILERNVEMLDGTRPHRRSSPDEGSIHTYPDMDPTWYQREYKYVPYISETGMHSITEAKSLYEIINPEEFKNLGGMYSDEFKNNHPEFLHHFVEFQASRIPRMLSRASHIDDMSNPTLEAIAEASQIGAGEFYQLMSDLTQANYPVTAGLMPWVFKRPWPVVSAIHLVDGFGQPSAPYYFLKRTYESTHVMVKLEYSLLAPGDKVPLDVVVIHAGEKLLPECRVELKVLDKKFNTIQHKAFPVETLEGYSKVTVIGSDEFNIPEDWRDQYFFILAELKDKTGALLSRSVYWPRVLSTMADPETRTKYRESPQPWPTFEHGPWLKPEVAETKTKLQTELISVEQLENGDTKVSLRISNTGKVPAFNTFFDVLGAKRCFLATDNYFWLSPGEEKELELKIRWREKIPNKASVMLTVQAWNAKKQIIKLD